jgi:sigma-E factor negative regulatory protein RseA
MRELPDDDAARARRELMSRLSDGDLDAVDEACVAWRDDAVAREAWATYQLIGDVLRSDELAAPAGCSEAFLDGFRSRMAAEPVWLAPVAAAAARATGRRHPRWVAPVAVAAGAAAVAVTLVTLRVTDPAAPAAPSLAQAPTVEAARGGGAQGVLTGQGANDPPWQVVRGKLIRDERLDAYLRAHRGAPEATPGVASGRFETVVLDQ